MPRLSDNQIALLLVAILAGALIVQAVPGQNGPIVAALAGGLLGFLNGAGQLPQS
ncbi:MAG TPA: hypothetical protein VGI30_05245 [Caulobacteraceae bacterium]